jgi:hypothetical protein
MSSQEVKQTLKNLDPDTRYIIRVRTVNPFGVASEWSEALDYTTGGEAESTTAETVVAGAGLYLSNDIEVNIGEGTGIQVNDDSIQISPSYVGQTTITTLGTITTGTWSATAIAVGYGGTGLTTYATGDIIYASSPSALARLAAASSGNVLLSGTSPSWGKVDLTAHITGILPIANGGTAASDIVNARINLGLGTSAVLDVDTDGTLAANSDTKIATQKATKTYVDAKTIDDASALALLLMGA